MHTHTYTNAFTIVLFTRAHLLLLFLAVATKANAASATPDRMHGSYHWDLERAASVALVPLFATQLAVGASPVLDTFFGVFLPLHIHIGKWLTLPYPS